MRSVSLCVIGTRGIIAEGLKSVLNGSCFRIKSQYASLAAFWKSAGDGEQGLSGIILDTDSNLLLGSSDLEDIRRWSAAVKIVLMTDDCRVRDIMAIACEADSVILTSAPGTAVLKALDLVLLGQTVYPARLFHSTRDPEPVIDADCTVLIPARDDMPDIRPANGFRNAVGNLSEREVQVVNLLCDGSSNKIIARNLGISEATVKVHVKAILRKTHTRNRTQAALLFSSASRPEVGAA
jgi:two-component system nitrate/nitrite response regulator NarL